MTNISQSFASAAWKRLKKNKGALLGLFIICIAILIALFAYLGIGMHPPEIPSAGPRERANFLYCYSINQTFYRPYPIIGNAFRKNGFGICFPITNHRKIRKSRLLSRLLKLPMLNNLLTWFIMTFRNAYLLTLSQNEDGTIDKYSQLENRKSELFVDITA